MKKITLSFFILFSLSSFAQLPHIMTLEEQVMMPDYLSSFNSRSLSQFGNTNPPVSPVRASAEWEEIDYLAVAWTIYTTTIREIVRAARLETKVIIICGSTCSGSTDSTSIKNTLTSNGIPLSNINFLYAPCNSIWSRDYGQWNMYTNDVDSLLLFDWIYNRPRPKDDTVPSCIAQFTNLPIYLATTSPNDLVHTGGNFMVDGFGTGFSSNLILNENLGKSETQINGIMQQYFGISRYIKFPTLPYDQIHHIDMHLKLLDEQTLLVGQYPFGVADGPQIEANLQYILSNFNSVFGTPYKVVRIPMPPDAGGAYPNTGGDYRTYTNSVFVNKTVIIPTYAQEYDTTALRIYQEALPGYTITGINCNSIITALGAIHCITKEVSAADPLLILHQSLEDTYDVINPYIVNARIQHRSGISSAEIYFRTDTLLPYSSVAMSLTSVPNNIWTGSIPAQPAGTRVYYYVHATAVSGKQQVRPMPAPAGYWAFNIL
ncbi:MAG: agmatine deiminase family protein, partial [Bacteroidia bacterium]|nr:agmatine deiminase family protein [Bacteroidia bacterium]